MLDNSKLIDGKDGQRLTQAIKDYSDALLLEKDAKVTKEKASKVIKELCTKAGQYETMDAVVNMTQYKGQTKFDDKKFALEHPDLYEQYCYKTSDSIRIGQMRIKSKV